jgi:radical SAM protein with 4Fe4S-binding SPASM domain
MEGGDLPVLALTHVDFNLTNACNLACAHCHSASGKALPEELTTAEIVSVVRDLHAMGVLSVAFAGGEPFMRPDLLEILEAACALDGWRVSVITNGLFFSERTLEEIVARCPDLGINVSVDGSNPDTFGDLRAQPNASPAARGAMFRRVTTAVRRVADAGLNVSVNTTMTRATMSDLVPTYRLAVDVLGAQSLVAIKFFPAGYGRQHLERYDFPWPVWSAAFAELTRQRLAGDLMRMQLSVPSAWEFYLPLVEARIDVVEAERAWRYRSPLRETSYARDRDIGDVAGFSELCIGGDGQVYPSVLMVGDDRMACGSIRELPLPELWRRSATLHRLRSLQVRDIEGACRGCDLASICGGGSRSRSIADFGRIHAPDGHCPLVNRSLEGVA